MLRNERMENVGIVEILYDSGFARSEKYLGTLSIAKTYRSLVLNGTPKRLAPCSMVHYEQLANSDRLVRTLPQIIAGCSLVLVIATEDLAGYECYDAFIWHRTRAFQLPSQRSGAHDPHEFEDRDPPVACTQCTLERFSVLSVIQRFWSRGAPSHYPILPTETLAMLLGTVHKRKLDPLLRPHHWSTAIPLSSKRAAASIPCPSSAQTRSSALQNTALARA
jgi:hypothetical protein